MVTIAARPSGTAATASENGRHEHVEPPHAARQTRERDHDDKPKTEVQKCLAHPLQPLLEGSFLHFRGRKKVRNLPELGAHSRSSHLGESGPSGDRRAEKHRIVALCEWRIGRRRRRRFLDRRAFARERRLHRRKRMRFDERRVGCDDIAGLEQEYVARDYLRCDHDDRSSIAKYARSRRGHGSERENRALRAVFLEEPHARIDDQDRPDGDRIARLTQRCRDDAGT